MHTEINPLMAIDPSAYEEWLTANRKFHHREYVTDVIGSAQPWMAAVYNLCLIWDELTHREPTFGWVDFDPDAAIDIAGRISFEKELHMEPSLNALNGGLVVMYPDTPSEDSLFVSMCDSNRMCHALIRIQAYLERRTIPMRGIGSDIDWGMWHSAVMCSINAFEIDSTLEICRRMEIGVMDGEEWNPLFPSYLYTEMYEMMCHLIRLSYYKCPTTNESRWHGHNTYVDDGLLSTEITLRYKESAMTMEDAARHGTPSICITLRDRSIDSDGPFFIVRFQASSQMF